LGMAINLDRDAHYWNIYLANYNDINKEVEVYIKWYEQDSEIACWIPDEADDNGKVIVKANSGIEITHSSYFLKF
jgi:hypothetical protein